MNIPLMGRYRIVLEGIPSTEIIHRLTFPSREGLLLAWRRFIEKPAFHQGKGLQEPDVRAGERISYGQRHKNHATDR
jgi:hypothetical protein